MHDLRLVGVHDDGEHLVLGDAEGQRFLLSVDEALRAAVRRDRAHLGQLQIEMGGGLRPREVQARVRAGATAEDVAAACGWPLDRVRRYEGPVLAEREHVASTAREVKLRRRGADQVTLGSEVSRRLAGRGVDPDTVTWDSWRTDDGPWTVVLTFPAGGRQRQARWHFDPAARSVVPADDEARWLSEQAPEGDGPLGAVRLTAVPNGSLYDIEADGGVDGPPARAERTASDDPLDLMTAMRSRRRERDLHRPSTRRHHAEPVDPADVPGTRHPAGRRRQPAAEPLELDPTLLADPPAAHPADSEVEASLAALEPDDVVVTDDLPDEATDRPHAKAQRWPLADRMHAASADEEDTGEIPAPGLAVAQLVADEPVLADEPGWPPSLAADEPARRRRLADAEPADALADADDADEDFDEEDGGTTRGGRHRPTAASRARRTSVPSWDDIMFGAKRD